MFRVLFLVIFLAKVYAEELSYFEQRKQMLNAEQAVVHPRPKGSNVIPFFYGPQKLRPTNFPNLINPEDLCSKHEKVFIFIAVRTVYPHIMRRNIHREVVNLYQNLDSSVRVVCGFFFARSKNEHENKLIKNESLTYRDVIQESFLEDYSNLTLKTLKLYKWVVEYCPNTEYVLVVNDEIFLDLKKLVNFLLKDYFSTTLNDHYALCQRVTNLKVIHHTFPWYKNIPKDYQYRGKRYPNHCHGQGYGAHITVINKLYKASNSTTYFMPDDVWTAVIAEKLRIRLDDHHQYYIITPDMEKIFADKSYFARPEMIIVADFGKLRGREEKILRNLLTTLKKRYKNYEELEKSISKKTEQCSKYIPSILLLKSFDPKILLLYIPVLIVLLGMFKVFKTKFPSFYPKCFK